MPASTTYCDICPHRNAHVNGETCPLLKFSYTTRISLCSFLSAGQHLLFDAFQKNQSERVILSGALILEAEDYVQFHLN